MAIQSRQNYQRSISTQTTYVEKCKVHASIFKSAKVLQLKRAKVQHFQKCKGLATQKVKGPLFQRCKGQVKGMQLNGQGALHEGLLYNYHRLTRVVNIPQCTFCFSLPPLYSTLPNSSIIQVL